MKRSSLLLMHAVCLLAFSAATAQDAEVSAEDAKQLESLDQATAGTQTPTDDVMRPTEHGIRLTPALAGAFSRAWIHESLEKDIGATLDENQKNRLADVATRRMLEMGHKYGKQVGPFFELAVETMGTNAAGQEYKPETIKEFGRQAKETAPIWRDFFGHMVEDCRPFLDADQLSQLEKKQARIMKAIDRFEERMDRWSRGERKDNEEAFDNDLDQTEDEAEAEDAARRTPEVRSAERRATWAINRLEPSNWREFLSNVRNFFKLTDEQYAQGQKILQDYLARVKEITTPDWREKARKNRILFNMQDALRKESPAPWLYRLEREYQEMVKPVRDMEKAYHLDIMGLVTQEQWNTALGDLHEMAAKHGMTPDEANLPFPVVTRPAP